MKQINLLGLVVIALAFFACGTPSGDVGDWKEYIDDKKTELCDCVAEARSIRNVEKSSREHESCILNFRLVLNDIEDDNKLTDDDFITVNGYIQGKFNESCN